MSVENFHAETGMEEYAEKALKQRDGDQKLPRPNDELSCQASLLNRLNQDMPERMRVGLARYGTLLQPFNGRDFARDAWEELMDLAVYFEGVRREREAMIALLKEFASVYPTTMLGKRACALLTSMGIPVGDAD